MSPAKTIQVKKTLSDLDKLLALINSEWQEYRQAITQNKKFEDVKVIYMHIKELKKQADAFMPKANELHLKSNGH